MPDPDKAKKMPWSLFFPWHFKTFASYGKELPCPCSIFTGAYGQTLFACHHQFLLLIPCGIAFTTFLNFDCCLTQLQKPCQVEIKKRYTLARKGRNYLFHIHSP
jgi:hypothetical protein